MQSLREVIAQAQKDNVAIGHFNVSTLEMCTAVINAAKHTHHPVIIGVSEGERDHIGIKNIVQIVTQAKEEGVQVYLNADHTYSYERVVEAIDAGFDAVIYDGAKLSYEENVRVTRRCTEYASVYKAKTGKDVLIEAELGYIGQSSQILDGVPEGVDLEKGLTTPSMAKEFIADTHVDLFAPAVGNIHGMILRVPDPSLRIDIITGIAQSTNVPLVLHGGSGNTDEDFINAIKAGICIVHISTELRLAYRQGLEAGLIKAPHEMAPYKYMKEAIASMEEHVVRRIQLFGGTAHVVDRI